MSPPMAGSPLTASFSAVLVIVSLLSGCGSPMDAREHEARVQLAEVKGWLFSMANQAGESVRTIGTVGVGRLDRGGETSIPLEVTGVHDAAIIAACDDDCSVLDLRLVTADGRLVGVDENDDAYPIIEIERGDSRPLVLKVSMPGCTRSPCTFAFQQLEYDDPEEAGGSCFAVSPDGLLMTSNHVVAAASEITITFADGRQGVAEVIRRSEGNDLALLQFPEPTEHWLPLAAASDITVGMQAFTVGFPSPDTLGATPKFTEGSVASLAGWEQEATLLQISIPIQPGSSGSPILSFDGTVIGVAESSASAEDVGAEPQLVNYARPAQVAALLLPSQRTLPRIAPARSREEAIERATKAVCLVSGK